MRMGIFQTRQGSYWIKCKNQFHGESWIYIYIYKYKSKYIYIYLYLVFKCVYWPHFNISTVVACFLLVKTIILPFSSSACNPSALGPFWRMGCGCNACSLCTNGARFGAATWKDQEIEQISIFDMLRRSRVRDCYYTVWRYLKMTCETFFGIIVGRVLRCSCETSGQWVVSFANLLR